MSGTSADAVDAVLADFSGGGPMLTAALSYPLPPAYQESVLSLSQSQTPVSPGQLAALDVQAGHLFAEAAQALLRKMHIPSSEIQAIGCHGQTLYHEPDGEFPYTWQIGDPNIIAQRTRITTVADFRRRDMAAGGQGAPLAPAFHAAFLRDGTENRAVLNIGGIANLTLLPASPREVVTGFDSGPGNALLDAWAQKHLQQKMDQNGAWAARGRLIPELLKKLLADGYFQQAPPKSTGRGYFNLSWLEKQLAGDAYAPVDVQRTLLDLSVQSVVDALASYAPQRILVCGGGVHNPLLMTGLQEKLPSRAVTSSAVQGIDPDWMEGLCFAWLAFRRLQALPGNLKEVTGASEDLVLGAVYAGGSGRPSA